MTTPAGFVGLGNMGAPMARHIVASGQALMTHDLAGDALSPDGANFTDTLGDLAARCDTVITCLPDGTASRAVVDGLLDVPGRRLRTIVECSTIGIAAARGLQRACEAAGVRFVDAPISGGVAGAVKGTLTVIVASDADGLAIARPVVEPFAANVFHVGGTAGQGQACKLLNNFLSATAMAATSEAMAFGERQGLDLETMLNVVNVSTGQNTATADKFPRRIVSGSYDAGFTSALFNKDLGLYAEAAADGATPVSPAVIALWRNLLDAHGNEDMTRVYPFVRDSQAAR